MNQRKRFSARDAVVVMATLVCLDGSCMQPGTSTTMANGPMPTSLKQTPVPEPTNLYMYVSDRQAAIQLGKALFWDMQVGSDSVQACGSCHFQAGADSRTKNQVSPGIEAGDTAFEVKLPNGELTAADFPTHKRAEPADVADSAVIRDSNDAVGSMGVFASTFVGLRGKGKELTKPASDPVNQVAGVSTRRVGATNAPSVINAVYHYALFWDGRANNIFNGANPFGPSDEQPHVWVSDSGEMTRELARLRNASLASQAVAPPMNHLEMTADGRTFPVLGKKLLPLAPLAKQLVHPRDSVLGRLSRARAKQGGVTGGRGLRTTYEVMVKAAFYERFWADTAHVITFAQDGSATVQPRPNGRLAEGQFTQMEANFALFFGLAVQMYEATLVPDDSLFDRVKDGTAQFTPQQQIGFDLFTKEGLCGHCHAGAEFTMATVSYTKFVSNDDHNAFQVMPMLMHDAGFTNTAVRPDTDGAGRGGTDAFGFPLSIATLAEMKARGELPSYLADYVPNLPMGTPSTKRVLIYGAQKTPTLRNIELTGPYFHDGSMGTLRQTVDFYVRGGNFGPDKVKDRAIVYGSAIPALQGNEDAKNALVAFMLTLTDERVRNKSAPFDHPQIFIPNGLAGDEQTVEKARPNYRRLGFDVREEVIELPAVGEGGLSAEGLPPLGTFLGLDPFQP